MKVESKKELVQSDAQSIFNYLANFNNFGSMLPEQIENWTSTTDTCSFAIKGLATLHLNFKNKTPYSQLVIEGTTNLTSEKFELIFDLASVQQTQTEVVVTFQIDINPMMAMMAKNPLQNFVNVLVQKLAEKFAQ